VQFIGHAIELKNFGGKIMNTGLRCFSLPAKKLQEILECDESLKKLEKKKIDPVLERMFQEYNIPLRDGIKLIISVPILTHSTVAQLRNEAYDLIRELFETHAVPEDARHKIMEYITDNYPMHRFIEEESV